MIGHTLRRPAARWPLAAAFGVVATLIAAQQIPAALAPATPDGSPAASVSFVPNAGQTDASVRYMTQGSVGAMYFTPAKAVLDRRRGKRGVALELRFRGANPAPEMVPEHRAAGRVNFIAPLARHTNLPIYNQLRYRDLWPGIDMVFRGEGHTLKYEFLVRPGADPRDIRLSYAGAERLSLGRNGGLRIGTQLGALRDSPPRTLQGTNAVDSRFALAGSTYGFAVGAYDHSRPLLIDPGLDYSTYVGDSGIENAYDVAVDGSGNAYVTGDTTSATFPTTPGAYDTSANGGYDVFVRKYTPAGALAYSTFVGGSGSDHGLGIAVDSAGKAYVVGSADAVSFNPPTWDFPTTSGAYNSTRGNVFVFKLDSAGSVLEYSTLVGPASTGRGKIAVDGSGAAYITGDAVSSTYPTTPGAYITTYNGSTTFEYVTKLNGTGTALDYSSFLDFGGMDVAVDGSGNAYLAGGGGPSSATTPGAFDTTYNGNGDAFLGKLNPAGSALVYGTFLGGASFGDVAASVGLDGNGNAYVTGYTGSADYPVTPGAFDTTHNGVNGDYDAFVTKVNSSGSSLAYSTFIGGSAQELAFGVAVDAGGNAYVAGYGGFSNDFPTTPGAYDTTYNGGLVDVFLSKLDDTGQVLAYSTWLGGGDFERAWGVAVDGAQNAWVAGGTRSTDYPTTATGDTTYGGSDDGFLSKLSTAVLGYARPKGATPIYAPLVVSYKNCASPGEVHSPPLAFPSCAPVLPTSANLTVGTADSNGAPANFTGSVRLDTCPRTGCAGSDLSMQVSMADVRCLAGVETCGSANTQAGPDYTGQLQGRLSFRLTDKLNGTSYSEPGTLIDQLLPFTIACYSTLSTTVGGGCGVATTVNSIMPGIIQASKRTIMQLDRLEVYDGGQDGLSTTAPNSLFAVQGVFAP